MTKMKNKVHRPRRIPNDYLCQLNVHIATLLSISNLTLRTNSSVIFLLLNPSILSLCSSPDPNANGVVGHILAEGVDIFPLIYVMIGISDANTNDSMSL